MKYSDYVQKAEHCELYFEKHISENQAVRQRIRESKK